MTTLINIPDHVSRWMSVHLYYWNLNPGYHAVFSILQLSTPCVVSGCMVCTCVGNTAHRSISFIKIHVHTSGSLVSGRSVKLMTPFSGSMDLPRSGRKASWAFFISSTLGLKIWSFSSNSGMSNKGSRTLKGFEYTSLVDHLALSVLVAWVWNWLNCTVLNAMQDVAKRLQEFICDIFNLSLCVAIGTPR